MKKYIKQIIILLVLIGVVAGIRLSGVDSHLTLENLKRSRELLERFVGTHYFVAVLVYVLLYTLSTAFSVPGATVLTLAGGFLFGAVPGAVYVNVGATVGALVAFLFSRHIVGDWFQRRYETQLAGFNRELEENGYLYLLTVRLIPAFPFFLINIMSGLTKIPVRTFIWTTCLGILPGSLVYTFAGRQLGAISSARGIATGNILIAFLLLALLTILPLVHKKLKAKHPSGNGQGERK
jgi:uncharacterized membrane protein YdjX (TVP38/TMEM64 family)